MNRQLPSINHKTVVFTRHARERLDLRRLNEDTIIQVMRNPKATHKADNGKIKFIGKVMGANVHAICKPIPEENKWLVISLWVRGEDDKGNFVNRKNYQRRGHGVFSEMFNILFIVILFIMAVVYFYTQAGS